MENQENDFMLTVDGKDHKFSELSNDNKLLVSHIRDLEGQIEQINFRYEQLNASKTFFSDKLVVSLREEQNSAESAESAESAAADTPVASASHVVCFLLSVLAAAAHSLWRAAPAIASQRPHA